MKWKETVYMLYRMAYQLKECKVSQGTYSSISATNDMALALSKGTYFRNGFIY